MRFYCLEINFNFNSVGLAYMFREMGLTVIQRDCCRASIGGWKMIIEVIGMSNNGYNEEYEGYKRAFYQPPQNKSVLKKEIKEDFGEMLATEMSNLKINILI